MIVSILLMMAAVGTFLLLSTLVSLYPGTGTVVRGPGDRAVQATGGACARVGPISGYGFGYWWDCDATLRDGDGGTRVVRVGPSVLSPDDLGRTVEIRESCRDGDCEYGRAANQWLEGLLLAVGKLGWFLMVILGGSAVVAVVRAVLGAPRYLRLHGRLFPRKADGSAG
ncbi:hypothetical protein E1258_02555 [Micromonospora sp. KC207]|uniref:DUF6346 domain-containing protein n=1 Tax=Micromonospora sp. KC207 TaxID=2530377 RepID=UPI0010500D1E|nr:DUF6346 domain-containing protein [Micromonospora sp. KC207]TDC66466.1 hypothetical protein E1258_02555 [Micromonospora sp. KC207]